MKTTHSVHVWPIHLSLDVQSRPPRALFGDVSFGLCSCCVAGSVSVRRPGFHRAFDVPLGQLGVRAAVRMMDHAPCPRGERSNNAFSNSQDFQDMVNRGFTFYSNLGICALLVWYRFKLMLLQNLQSPVFVVQRFSPMKMSPRDPSEKWLRV